MADSFSTTLYAAGSGFASNPFVADLNGDGLPDVIVPQGTDTAGGTEDVQFDVLLNDGTGRLLPPVAYDAGSGSINIGGPEIPNVLAVADVTGDGRPDVLVAFPSLDAGTQIAVAVNTGGGSFAAPVVTATLPAGFTPELVQDVTGDGIADLIGVSSSGSVGVAPGLGGGAFAAVQYSRVGYGFPGGSRVFVLPTGTPGSPDLVTFGQSIGFPSGTLSVLDNSGNGSFTLSQTFTSSITASSATIISDDTGLVIADVNGDGLPDLIEEGRGSYNASPEFLEVFLNNGAGGLDAPMTIVNPAGTAGSQGVTFGVVPSGLAVADVTGDGQSDIMLSVTGGLVVLPNTGGGTFGAGTFSATGSSTPRTLQPAILAGNGVPDLIGIDPPDTGGAVVVVETPISPETACFAAGTRILTARGEVAVEDLRVGDAVMALLGQELARVRWIGHRRLRPRAHPRPDLVQPVRILAGAFGEGRPCRDLRVSPGHALLVDGMLVPAELLVNGASVVQEDVDAVTYWHVELDRHDVLLADGLPAESYLDVGNRGAFENGGAVRTLHPEFPAVVHEAACAPALREGPGLAAIRERLLRRACTEMGFATTTDSGLALLADGRMVPTLAGDGERHRFVVPADGRVLRLCSRRWVPRQMLPQGDDTRLLGVCVRGLWIDGRQVDLACVAGQQGWHALEGDAGQGSWCWTDGDAVLPAGRVIELKLGGMMLAWDHGCGPGTMVRPERGPGGGLRRSVAP